MTVPEVTVAVTPADAQEYPGGMTRTDLPTTEAPGDERLGEPQARAWRSLLEAHARLPELLERELRAEEQLPMAWYDVLVHLSEADEHRLRMQELASAVLLSKSGLTRLVDRMEADGLVCRSACPSDKRGTNAELTPRGLQMLRSTAPTHVRGVGEHFGAHLDDEDAVAMTRMLTAITEHATARLDEK